MATGNQSYIVLDNMLTESGEPFEIIITKSDHSDGEDTAVIVSRHFHHRFAYQLAHSKLLCWFVGHS